MNRRYKTPDGEIFINPTHVIFVRVRGNTATCRLADGAELILSAEQAEDLIIAIKETLK